MEFIIRITNITSKTDDLYFLQKQIITDPKQKFITADDDDTKNDDESTPKPNTLQTVSESVSLFSSQTTNESTETNMFNCKNHDGFCSIVDSSPIKTNQTTIIKDVASIDYLRQVNNCKKIEKKNTDPKSFYVRFDQSYESSLFNLDDMDFKNIELMKKPVNCMDDTVSVQHKY